MNGRTLIGGLGSLVMGDDGIGPRIIAMLEERYELPEHVDLIDIGTPGLGLMSYIIGYETVILIDAVHDQGAPGDVKLYGRDELFGKPLQARVGPHDPAVVESLLTADMLDQPIKNVWLIGVIPQNTKLNTEMTHLLNERLEPIFRYVVEVLEQKGVEMIPRAVLAA
ncbi:MAG: hydrogenase maturation protease [Bacteroidetes bacterium]|nr:hydrogenase maturation protease [Bacteroidota bacterium]